MQVIPTPIDCANNCVPSGTASVPGTQGIPGNNGTNGTDGQNSYTTSISGTDVMPAEGASVTVLTDTANTLGWAIVGEPVFVQFWGTMLVTAANDGPNPSITLQNLEDTASGAYAQNAAPGTVLPAGSRIAPSGWQGVTGTLDSTLFLQVANNLNDVADAPTSRSNLGLGSIATFDQGVANGQVPNIHDPGGLQANLVVSCTGLGLQTTSPGVTRGFLGLGDVAVHDVGITTGKVPLVDEATLTAGEIVVASAGGLVSESNATILAQLGITTQDMLMFQQIQNLATDGGTFTQTTWQAVPVNTEVIDTGNHGSISGNLMTLDSGTYRYDYVLLGYRVGSFQGRLFDTTAGAEIFRSYSAAGNSPNASTSNISLVTHSGRFTIAVDSVIRWEANCSATRNTDGFGQATGFADAPNCPYSYIKFYKE